MAFGSQNGAKVDLKMDSNIILFLDRSQRGSWAPAGHHKSSVWAPKGGSKASVWTRSGSQNGARAPTGRPRSQIDKIRAQID